MSHAIIGVATLTTGGLVIGGLIVAGFIAGKAVVYAIEKDKETKARMAEETLEANKDDLKNEFTKSVLMVLDEINVLDADCKGQLKIMLKIDEKNQIATRLTKFVATEEEKTNISTYQKQKDSEIAKKWCKNYDKFLVEMKKYGVDIEIKLRKGPGEEDISYSVNDKISKKKVNESKKITKNDQMKL